ncbi:hypothetical protein [Saccharospirillum impatiens]|uniref:hypothetical protein n=1 Tax=Saccharospirillum impatiens TaxID=169438 RepID=UPI000491208C|nr:hypothetical protein [Saccharospirillum impatiens]
MILNLNVANHSVRSETHGRPSVSAALAAVLLLGLAGFAEAEWDVWWDLSAGAEVVAYPQVSGLDDAMQPPAWALDQTFSGRLNLAWYPTTSLEMGVHYGLAGQVRLAQADGDGALQQALQTDLADFRWRDLDTTVVDNDPVRVSQNLDRAFVRAYPSRGDITLGRQPISFGLARVYSPVDVILPSGLQAQEPAYRAGVDALRWLLPMGAVTELDLGWVFGDDSVLFARGYTQVSRFTWEATALTVNQTHHVLGLGAQTALGDWGVWQEMAVLATQETTDGGTGFRATLGVDQQILDDVYVVAEYHFNSTGADGDYAEIAASGWHQTGLVSPWGRHYISLQASKPLSPLWQASLGQAINLSDHGVLMTGALSRSLGNNSTLDVTFLHALAKRPDVRNAEPRVVDEYGVYPSRIQVNWSAVF